MYIPSQKYTKILDQGFMNSTNGNLMLYLRYLGRQVTLGPDMLGLGLSEKC